MDLITVFDMLLFGPVTWILFCVGLYCRPKPGERGLYIWFQLIMLAVSLVLTIAGYLLAPRPKQPQPDSTKDFDDPTADAGRPIPVVFGTKTVKGLNVLWFADKRTFRYKVKA